MTTRCPRSAPTRMRSGCATGGAARRARRAQARERSDLAGRREARRPTSPRRPGSVLRNVRLTEALRARLDDLRAAQKRLVAAQDDERRKLERNIHDGAQQQLVALAVKARLAAGLTERDPAKVGEMLAQIEAETHDALEDLRDLARGIYPPLLADKGLEAALVAQARKSPVPVDVRRRAASSACRRRSRRRSTSPRSRRCRTPRSTRTPAGPRSRCVVRTGRCRSRSPTTAWGSIRP